MARPTEEHLQSVHRVLRYVSNTKDRGLLYQTGDPEQLVSYTDVDWVGNAGDRRSTSGFTFSLGSIAVPCSSKKLPTVALSSTEVEYREAAVTTCEAIWLKRLLKDLQVEVSDSTLIYSDKLSNIELAKNPVFHARTKHIEVQHHFVRDRILCDDVELTYILTDRQNTDIFTKPLGLDKLRKFSGVLGLRHLDLPNLRGRQVPQDHRREQERSRSHRTESEEEFDFRSVEEAEGGPVEEAKSGREGSIRKK